MKSISNLIVRFILTVALVFSVGSSRLLADTIDDQVRALDAAILETQTHYGMLEFKENLFGVTIEKLREKYTRLIRTATTLEEDLKLVPKVEREELTTEQFEQLLIQYAAEWRDGHFNIRRDTSANFWSVGIYAIPIEGRLTVTGFDDKIYVKELSVVEPKVGDWVVSVNGEPVEKLAERFEHGISLATYDSRMTLAYRLILNRNHRWTPGVKTGDEVRVRFQRPNPKYKEPPAKKEGEAGAPAPAVDAGKPEPKFIEFEVLYHWVNNVDYNRARTWFPYDLPAPTDDKYVYGFTALRTHFDEGLKGLKDTAAVIRLDDELNVDIRRSKALKKEADKKLEKAGADAVDTLDPEVRKLAAAEEITEVPAYIVRYKGKNIGVIRIPNYGIFIKEIRWLGEVIGRMEKLTDVLIVDQLKNGGGRIWSGAQVARLFADRDELSSISMNMRLSKALLSNIELSDTDKNPDEEKPVPASESEVKPGVAPENPDEDLMPTRNFTQLFLGRHRIDTLRAKYEAGEGYSGFMPFFGVQNRYKGGAHGRIAGRDGKVYSKPVLVLNDPFSASCGDFFPSIMQTNGRALIYGGTSMGLGAPVYRSAELPFSEMFMRCPFGDCLKPDNLPIENVGAVPDLPRWVTGGDLQDSFKSWTTGALDVAIQLAGGDSFEKVKETYFKGLVEKAPRLMTLRRSKGFLMTLAQKSLVMRMGMPWFKLMTSSSQS